MSNTLCLQNTGLRKEKDAYRSYETPYHLRSRYLQVQCHLQWWNRRNDGDRQGTEVDQWVQETLALHAENPTVVGLDIEWRPHVNRWMSNKTATLQLCIDKRCLIVQLFYIDCVPESLKDFLGNPRFTFVGVEVDGDVDKLRVEYGLECAAHKDVRELAKWRWPGRFRRPGLKDLALEVVGLVMDKPKHVGMSDWQARVLNMNQVEYACIDAYASYKLGTALL